MSIICRLTHRRHFDPPETMHSHADIDGAPAGYVGRFCRRCQSMRRPLTRFAPQPGVRAG